MVNKRLNEDRDEYLDDDEETPQLIKVLVTFNILNFVGIVVLCFLVGFTFHNTNNLEDDVQKVKDLINLAHEKLDESDADLQEILDELLINITSRSARDVKGKRTSHKTLGDYIREISQVTLPSMNNTIAHVHDDVVAIIDYIEVPDWFGRSGLNIDEIDLFRGTAYTPDKPNKPTKPGHPNKPDMDGTDGDDDVLPDEFESIDEIDDEGLNRGDDIQQKGKRGHMGPSLGEMTTIVAFILDSQLLEGGPFRRSIDEDRMDALKVRMKRGGFFGGELPDYTMREIAMYTAVAVEAFHPTPTPPPPPTPPSIVGGL